MQLNRCKRAKLMDLRKSRKFSALISSFQLLRKWYFPLHCIGDVHLFNLGIGVISDCYTNKIPYRDLNCNKYFPFRVGYISIWLYRRGAYILPVISYIKRGPNDSPNPQQAIPHPLVIHQGARPRIQLGCEPPLPHLDLMLAFLAILRSVLHRYRHR